MYEYLKNWNSASDQGRSGKVCLMASQPDTDIF